MNIKNRRSIRLHGYDYSQEGAYYVTVCTQDRLCLFGSVQNGEMVLNEIGQYVEKCWLEISTHFPNTVLHEYMIMPNHVHGIVEIVGANDYLPAEKNDVLGLRAKDVCLRRALRGSPLRGTSKTIDSIVRGFKIGVTKWFRQNTDIHDVWQRNDYEHIICDGNDYDRIANYIIDNPRNWKTIEPELKH